MRAAGDEAELREGKEEGGGGRGLGGEAGDKDRRELSQPPGISWVSRRGSAGSAAGDQLGQQPGDRLSPPPGDQLGQPPGDRLSPPPGDQLGQPPGIS